MTPYCYTTLKPSLAKASYPFFRLRSYSLSLLLFKQTNPTVWSKIVKLLTFIYHENRFILLILTDAHVFQTKVALLQPIMCCSPHQYQKWAKTDSISQDSRYLSAANTLWNLFWYVTCSAQLHSCECTYLIIQNYRSYSHLIFWNLYTALHLYRKSKCHKYLQNTVFKNLQAPWQKGGHQAPRTLATSYFTVSAIMITMSSSQQCVSMFRCLTIFHNISGPVKSLFPPV